MGPPGVKRLTVRELRNAGFTFSGTFWKKKLKSFVITGPKKNFKDILTVAKRK